MKYWFVRSPFKTRTWEDVLMAGVFSLYGIRGNAAKKNISEMKKGDLALWYSSAAGKKIFGIMKVKNTAYPDSTSDSYWLAIDFIPVTTLKRPIPFEEIKNNQHLSGSSIVKQIRISVTNVLKEEYQKIITISGSLSG
ncbi:MAG: EVE domain-containing protein [Desulfobacteraceae bacterium]|jgi:predicted RNA-binding protein with PUA-like domain